MIGEKEIVLITGGAGGIGGQVVQLLAERGIKVVVLDVIPMTFDTRLCPNSHLQPTSNNSQPKMCITTNAISRHQPLSPLSHSRSAAMLVPPTIIINNAGVARGKNILDATEKDVRFTFEVNTLAHYWIAKEFLPSLVTANHGMVVTVASIAAYVTAPTMVDYASSKAAALAFHEGLTAELTSRYNALKVRTVVINQGYTKTPLFEGYGNDSPFLMPSLEPATVAEAIVNQILTGSSGQVILPGFWGDHEFF